MEISRIKNILKSKSGQAFPMTVAIVLSLLIVIVGISEYFRLTIIAQGIRDSLQTAVLSTVTENYANVYHGTREGYSGAFLPSADSFEESLNYGDIYEKLASTHNLMYNNGKYEKISADELEFAISDLDVEIENIPLASSVNSDEQFEIHSYITLEVPVKFVGELLPNMEIRIKTSAGYTPIF